MGPRLQLDVFVQVVTQRVVENQAAVCTWSKYAAVQKSLRSLCLVNRLAANDGCE
jgi:hypothetical protein